MNEQTNKQTFKDTSKQANFLIFFKIFKQSFSGLKLYVLFKQTDQPTYMQFYFT
jgi:hypothetical protein